MGLGDVNVHSFLDQPFNADIDLLDVGSTPLSGIKVNLASVEEFNRVGLERSYILGLLTFTVEKKANGKVVVRVQSNKRISEPFMQILLNLTWAEGDVYRSYTILLDPPNYPLDLEKRQFHHGVKRQFRSQDNSHEVNAVDNSEYSQVGHSISHNVLDNRGVVTYGPTTASETIWQVAQHYKTPDILLQQLILAIVGTNPDAFTEGNLNGLKEGSRLRIPTISTINKVPAELARLEVLAQDKAWQSRQAVEHALLPPYIGSTAPVGLTEQEITPLGYSITTSIVPAVPSSSLLPLSSSLLPVHEGIAPTIDSVGGLDASAKQIRQLQIDNKQLQQQLAVGEQEIKKLRMKIHHNMLQQGGGDHQQFLAAKVALWPWVLFLLGAGGGLIYWWMWLRPTAGREEEPLKTDDISIYTASLPVEPILVPPSFDSTPTMSEPDNATSEQQEGSTVLRTEVEKPAETEQLSSGVVNTEETHQSDLPSQENLIDDHILEFEPESQQLIEESPENLDVPEKVIKPKTKETEKKSPKKIVMEKQEDEHSLDFVLNPVEAAPTLETIKPVKSKAALNTLLDLAKTYIGMEDFEAAKQSLQEVMDFGSEEQKLEAKHLLDGLNNK